MLKIFFGEVNTGRLLRLPFLGYSLLLQLLVFGFVLVIILAIGAGEHLIGGDLQQAQNMLREWFTIPFFIIFGLFMGFIGFVVLNITAKRIRDTGLPGWWILLTFIVLEIIVSIFISQKTASGIHFILIVILFLIPTDTFAKTKIDN